MRYTWSLDLRGGRGEEDRAARAEAACRHPAGAFRSLVAPDVTPNLRDLDVRYVGAIPRDAFAPLPPRRDLGTLRMVLRPSDPAATTFDRIESTTGYGGVARRVEIDARALPPLDVLMGDDMLRATDLAAVRMNNLLRPPSHPRGRPVSYGRYRPYETRTDESAPTQWILLVRWHRAFVRITDERVALIEEWEGDIW